MTKKSMKCIFYSYKGGTGRTTSLINVGYHLTKFGKSVVIIDFDFAAPGCNLYEDLMQLFEIDFDPKYVEAFNKNKIHLDLKKQFEANGRKLSDDISVEPPKDNDWKIDESEKFWVIKDNINDLYFHAIKKENKLYMEYYPKGVLDFLSDSLKNKRDENKEELNIDNYIYKTKARWKNKFDGPLYLMGVSSLEKLGKLKIEVEFHVNSIISNKFLENLISLIERRFSPDYILIDSRPGREYIVYFETVGLNLGKNDLIIPCTNYNKTVIEETLNIVQKIKSSYLDDKEVRFHPILLQRPNGLMGPDQEKSCDIIEERVKHWPLFTMPKNKNEKKENKIIELAKDSLFNYLIIKDKNHHNFEKYKELARRIIEFNEEDILNQIEEAKKGELKEIITKFAELKNNKMYNSDYNLYYEYGKILFEKKKLKSASKEFEEAYAQSKKIVEGGHPEIALWLGKTYYRMYTDNLFRWDEIPVKDSHRLKDILNNYYGIDWKETPKIDKINDLTITITPGKNSSDKKSLSLSLIIEKNEVKLQTDDGITDIFNVTNENGKLNIYKDEYIQKAVEWFEIAEKLKCSSEYELYLDWSKALIEHSKILSTQGGIVKLEIASTIIEKAIKSKETQARPFEPFETKGMILIENATLLDKNSGIIEVLEKSNKALETSDIRGGGFITHYLWAKNLYKIALLTAEIDARSKNLKDADEHFEIAARYQKEDVDTNYLWGLTLTLLAKYNTGDKQRNLLIKASEKLGTAANINKENQKAHFYLGAVLFMLEKMVDEPQKPLYFRDAFYNMEWTVSIHHKFLGFYFKAEDIQRFKDTYVFTRTLENYYEYDPLFEEWVGKISTNKEYEDILKKAILDQRNTINGVI